MIEQWRDILDGIYQVSEGGSIRRVKRGRTALPGRIMKPFVVRREYGTENGYLMVDLKDGVRSHTKMVHQWVALAFLGPRPAGAQVNHKDGNKRNNHHSNLEYVTPQQNMDHAKKHGLVAVGERASQALLTRADIIAIRKAVAGGELQKSVAVRFGIHFTTVNGIVRGRAWAHVPDFLPARAAVERMRQEQIRIERQWKAPRRRSTVCRNDGKHSLCFSLNCPCRCHKEAA